MTKLYNYSILVVTLIFVAFSILVSFVESGDIENYVRSSSLSEVITEEGDEQRIDYYDKDGQITIAADKHYATLVRVKGNHTQLEEYFDDLGRPARQALGYYAVLREYDALEQNIKVTYLDIDGYPTMISPGYSIAERIYNRENQVEWEMYCDVAGKGVETKSIGYGCHKEYDKNGRNTLITYVDKNLEPLKTSLGYAMLQRNFYEEGINAGKVKDEFYFDESGQPIPLIHGEYGLHREYDEFGRCTTMVYLDSTGNPIITKEGYSIIKRTFYPDDSVKTEMYFDFMGKAVALSQGQYGILKEKQKEKFLDVNGKIQFNLRNYLYANPISVILVALTIAFGSMFLSKKANAALLFIYIFFIIYMTLMYRVGREPRIELLPFWSYKQFLADATLREEILFNIWLFIPLGAILGRLLSNAYAIALSIITSAFVEVVQFFSGTGLCELDDLFSNGLGAIVGLGLIYSFGIVIGKLGLERNKS